MKIKKYTADNMSEAMRLIKEDLGPNAVIVSSEPAPRKNIKSLFGPRQMIVTAAAEQNRLGQDLPVYTRSRQIQAAPNTMLYSGEEVMDYTDANDANDAKDAKEDTGEISGDFKELLAAPAVIQTRAVGNSNRNQGLDDENTDLLRPQPVKERVIPDDVVPAKLPEPLLDLESEGDAWFKVLVEDLVNQQEGREMEKDGPTKWAQVLNNMEIHEKIIDNILSGINEAFQDDKFMDTEEFIILSLKNNVVKLVERAYGTLSSQRIKTFIGPTGVGKTTTLVKLATRYQLFEQKNIALVALYDHRFGALEELNYYAEIIKAPVEIVMTPEELSRAVRKHDDKDYILIDTEGRPSKNTGQVLELKTFIDAVGADQDIHLVLSATTKNRDIMRIIKDFSRAGINKMIFTKLDETDTLGSMLNAVCETGIPVAYVTDGQNIPDNIHALTSKKLANMIFEGFDLGEAAAEF